MAYEYKSEDVYGLASSIGADVYEKGGEIWFRWCPYCRGGGTDKNTFSVNKESGAFFCFRSSCGKKGHFVELARDLGYKLDLGYTTGRKYRELPQRPIETKDAAVRYLESRGISEGVTKRYRITSRNDDERILVFPFYDESGKLVFVKYRNTEFVKGVTPGNKEWCERDTKPILFGMDQCSGFDRVVITEGQIDSLSLIEAGVKNAVSVPTGAKGFTWLDACFNWLNKFNTVVVMGDCEKGTITLAEELNKRIPRMKVVKKEDYLGEKDANDILRKYGAAALRKAVEHADIQPVESIKRMSEVKKVDLANIPKVKTGIEEIDRKIGGICYGQVALLTGRRGEGKSTFMSQIVCNALESSQRTLIYSGELADFHVRSWLDSQLAGAWNMDENTNEYGDKYYTLQEGIADRIGDWYADNCYIYDNTAVIDDNEMESLLETVERAVQRYDINLVCIDNLMTALEVDPRVDVYREQSAFVGKLKSLAMKYNISIILVAHPRKTSGELDNDAVSGSADITNKVDIVMTYGRSKNNEYDSEITITKNRLGGVLVGQRDSIKMMYDPITKRIQSANTGRDGFRYGWESDELMERRNTGGELPF